MKKIFAVMLCILLVVSLCACGGATNQADENSQESTISDQTSTITSADGSEEAEWKLFLKDYEKWVDDYIALVKKYNANPTDITILNDYTKMAAEMADWSSRADDIQKELESSPEALAEYSKELSRIVAKLSTVAN